VVLHESLSPEQRAVLLLHDVFDYRYPEIAAIVDKSASNVRQLAARARLRPTGRRDTPRRNLAAGKSPLEALRCLKRRLSNMVYQQVILDTQHIRTGAGGQTGATLSASAAGSIPTADTSEKPLPGPVTSNPRTPILAGA